MKTFDGKVAFITGAAHGQGRATALALAKEGAAIAAFDVATKIEYPAYAYGTGEELKSLKSEIEVMGEKCEIFAVDVRNDEDVTNAVEGTIKAFGQIDILFNNAGNLLPVPWIESEDTAELVLFLASDKARYATGSQFVIDAGLLSV